MLHAFGLSASKEMEQIRVIHIGEHLTFDLDQTVGELNRDLLIGFARFWHGLPDGVKSSRTIRNRLHSARKFFHWRALQNYGFAFPEDIAGLYTAADVKTPAASYDLARLKKILANASTRGGIRLTLYVLLGLILPIPVGVLVHEPIDAV